MSQPIASLSLDLDNKWSYMKIHGDPGWEQLPSYLDVAVPRVLDLFESMGLTATVFVVGQDAAQEKNRAAIAAIAGAGHEIGNHSFHHEPWLSRCSEDQIEAELEAAEEHIVGVTGQRPVGFRGPGFSSSEPVLRALARRGYLYDASTLPTFLGPLARAYYFATGKLTREQKQQRKVLFGRLRDGFQPLRPHWRPAGRRSILEIPVTTMPLLKVPIHVSYLLYLRQFSRALAMAYFRTALALCRLTGIGPSLLLHPLDFLGGDDEPDLAFFPAMNLPGSKKVGLVRAAVEALSDHYRIVSVREHARHARRKLGVPAGCPAPGVPGASECLTGADGGCPLSVGPDPSHHQPVESRLGG